jgi:hypothetical protein
MTVLAGNGAAVPLLCSARDSSLEETKISGSNLQNVLERKTANFENA